ncbi:MAG: hypothetical protein V3U93_06135 [Alphaproteobacteria bacterium]
MTEAEQENLALENLLAALDRKMGGVAYRTVSQVAPPEVGDTLDRTVRGFEYGARAVWKMLAAGDAADPFVAQMPKIIREVMDDYQAFGTALSRWWSTCLSRQIEGLERGDRAEQRREVGR